MRTATFIGFENSTQEQEIKALYAEFGYIIPPWILDITFYSSQDSQSRGFINVSSEYLKAEVFITPLFFDNTDDKRKQVFKHELVHSFISEITDWSRDKIQILCDDEKMLNILNEELRLRMEKVVEFLARIV